MNNDPLAYPDGWRDAIQVPRHRRTPEQRALVATWRRTRRARARREARRLITTPKGRDQLLVIGIFAAVVITAYVVFASRFGQ